MLWGVVLICAIALLAWAFRKATKNSPFENTMGCTPRISHLKQLEDPAAKGKKENLW